MRTNPAASLPPRRDLRCLLPGRRAVTGRCPWLPQRLAGPTELKHFAVSADCEDSSTNARTDDFCRGLSSELGQNCKVAKETWLFGQLCVPGLRAIAAGEATLAQLIIISAHHAEALTDGVKSWIDQWLGRTNNHGIVLLALFDPVYQAVSSSMKVYLQDVANRGDMEFLVK